LLCADRVDRHAGWVSRVGTSQRRPDECARATAPRARGHGHAGRRIRPASARRDSGPTRQVLPRAMAG